MYLCCCKVRQSKWIYQQFRLRNWKLCCGTIWIIEIRLKFRISDAKIQSVHDMAKEKSLYSFEHTHANAHTNTHIHIWTPRHFTCAYTHTNRNIFSLLSLSFSFRISLFFLLVPLLYHYPFLFTLFVTFISQHRLTRNIYMCERMPACLRMMMMVCVPRMGFVCERAHNSLTQPLRMEKNYRLFQIKQKRKMRWLVLVLLLLLPHLHSLLSHILFVHYFSFFVYIFISEMKRVWPYSHKANHWHSA